MFWLAIIGLGVAFAFAKLGALSVWVGILAAGIKLALLAIVALVAALIWKRVSGPRS